METYISSKRPKFYQNHPVFCTVWCCLETVFFAGNIFGWGSLQFVLKTEKFYTQHCYTEALQDDDRRNVSFNYEATTFSNSSNFTFSQYDSVTDNLPHRKEYFKECPEQESRLNLWFSISVGFTYLMCAFLGPFIRKCGMRLTRFFFIVVYAIGCLCLAFASPVVPWLICPGLCCIGIAGMNIYATNIQVCLLFPRLRATIATVFVGLFDVSSFMLQLVKVAYENSIPRKYSFIAMACLHVTMVATSTFVFLPSRSVIPKDLRDVKADEVSQRKRWDIKSDEISQSLLEIPPQSKEVPASKSALVPRPEGTPSLLRTLLSPLYLLHLYWMSVNALRFLTFIGFLGVWLEILLHGNQDKEDYYLSVFSYTTIGAGGAAITAGLLHDWYRKKYAYATIVRQQRMPIVVPFCVTIAISAITTSLMFIPEEEIAYVVFILFTFFRSYMFSYAVTYLNEVFPLEYFPVLFGIMQFSAGVSGLLQYAVFEWYQAYDGAYLHVNVFLVVVEISSAIHPLYIWIKCRNSKDDITIISNQQIEIIDNYSDRSIT